MSEKKIDLSPFLVRARGFVSQGRVDDALGLYSDVIRVDPENAAAYADRGTTYAMAKKFDLAIADLERAFALGHKEPYAYCTVATIHVELKQFPKALEYFAQAIQIDPKNALAYYNRSSALHGLGDKQAAIADLERCLSLGQDERFNQSAMRKLEFFRTNP